MRRVLSGLLLGVLVAASAFAQSTTSLRGTVYDTGGAIIPGAAVTLLNTETRTSRSTLSDAEGVYKFLKTAQGKYEVKIKLAGFTKAIKRGIT